MSIDSILFGIILCGLLIVAVLTTKILSGSILNPITLYLGSWFIPIYGYYINILGYDEISRWTWFVIISSLICFLLGAAIPLLSFEKHRSLNSRQAILAKHVSPEKLRLAILIIFIIGGLFHLVYLYYIYQLYGLGILLQLPALRGMMRDDGVVPGFYYFYFYEMVLPLSILYISIFGRKKTKLLILFSILATFALLFTAAKVNVFKAIFWGIFIYTFLNIDQLNVKNTLRTILVIVSIGLLLFLFHTGMTGEVKGQQFSDIYARFSAQLPTLDKLLHDQTVEFQHGKLIVLPLTKLLHVFIPSIDVPSHILEFYQVPYLWNIATYLDIMYKDFGVAGTLFIPFIFGIIASYSFVKFLHYPERLWLLYFNVIIGLWIWGSPSVAGFIKPVYWFQLICGGIICWYVSNNSRSFGNFKKKT